MEQAFELFDFDIFKPEVVGAGVSNPGIISKMPTEHGCSELCNYYRSFGDIPPF